MRRRGPGAERGGGAQRRLLGAAVLAVATVLVTGCFGGDVDVRVDDDGSGQVVAELVLDPSTSTALEQVDVSSLVGRADPTVDVEIEPISSGGLEGYRIVVPFEDVASLTTVLTQGVDVAGTRVRLMESLSITNDPADDSWTMDAVVLPADQVLAQLRSSGLPGLAGAEVGSLDLSLSVALPGEVERTNAPSSDGGTATWPVGEYRVPAALQMRTEPGGFPTLSPVQMVLGGALLVVLLGVMLALWGASAAARRRATKGRPRARRRSRRDRAAAGAGSGGWSPGDGTAEAWGTTRGTALPPLQDGEQHPPPSDPPSPQA